MNVVFLEVFVLFFYISAQYAHVSKAYNTHKRLFINNFRTLERLILQRTSICHKGFQPKKKWNRHYKSYVRTWSFEVGLSMFWYPICIDNKMSIPNTKPQEICINYGNDTPISDNSSYTKIWLLHCNGTWKQSLKNLHWYSV